MTGTHVVRLTRNQDCRTRERTWVGRSRRTAMDGTELRVHNVSGTPPDRMLCHPSVIRIAGDDVAGFTRRWWSTRPPYREEESDRDTRRQEAGLRLGWADCRAASSCAVAVAAAVHAGQRRLLHQCPHLVIHGSPRLRVTAWVPTARWRRHLVSSGRFVASLCVSICTEDGVLGRLGDAPVRKSVIVAYHGARH